MFDILEDVVDAALSPVESTLDILEGLSEGEIRTQAIIDLGKDVAMGMAVSELIEWYQER